MKVIAQIVIVAIIAVGFGLILSHGWSKNEIVECEKWLAESREYALWYSMDWQREQCKMHGYELPERYQR